MNETEHDEFEAELRRLTPARPPEPFMELLRAADPSMIRPRPAPAPRRASLAGWLAGWRWLALATPATIAAIIIIRLESSPLPAPKNDPTDVAPIKASGVQINHELVSSFDAVAQLPGGEPVRFHCQKWIDQMVLRDKYQRVLLQESSPRLEVIPVRFETY